MDLEEIIRTQGIKIASLSKNSTNSGKKPSSDDITNPKKKKKKKGNGKKRKKGGQPGHAKHERAPFGEDEIDEFVPHILPRCPGCGYEKVKLLDSKPRIQQQVEIETIIAKKVENRLFAVWCEGCQKIHYAPLPPDVVKEGLFKTRITALTAYMSHVCHASFSTIRKFVRDILGVTVSRGFLAKTIQKVSMSLEKPYQELLDRLPLETRLNIDETGHKENGDRFWTWVFKADLYVLFRIDKSRGSKVLVEVLGEEFDGAIGCDYYSSYRKYMKDFNVTVQFCIAHLIRDIKYLTGLPDKNTRAYGNKLLECVKKMFKVIHRRENMDERQFENAMARCKENIIKAALEDVPSSIDSKGKEANKEAWNMAKRFRDHGESYFTFITTPGMDPTNNVAEQAIRFVVIDRHIKQGTRSVRGRKANERIWTVIATCALQGKSVFEFILKAVEAYFNEEPAPSLIPDTS
jgi:transposase